MALPVLQETRVVLEQQVSFNLFIETLLYIIVANIGNHFF